MTITSAALLITVILEHELHGTHGTNTNQCFPPAQLFLALQLDGGMTDAPSFGIALTVGYIHH